ncbi:hypothetical protein EYB33_12185 [Lysinibacillus sphaericus]|uniref:hypothetical protein n=1 Tax=Lysinibacillus TaxID=400634 RepID=UPI00084AA0B6|nr:hypothetical protein [Lysinibacillus sphaericus]OEC01275.1 hypothetical protein GY31_13290 [Lysinibacillus sphaericus]UDK97019.1 hypothetical protein EYB33_12185 [Lysinibacillus sphaericus]
MAIYKATLKFATPNQAGQSLDFESASVLKEIHTYFKDHNEKQSKTLKILEVKEHSLTVIMSAGNVYGDGRDFTALSNILRNNGWLKFSSTNNLLTASSFEKVEDVDFSKRPLLPKEYNYIWTQDFNKLITDQHAIDLLKSLFILAAEDQQYLTSKASKQKYENCLYRVKEALFDAFH